MKRPGEAQYLLRLDDLCPTMDHVRWSRLQELITRFKLQPILAVVPENRDPELMCDEPDPAFWSQMRELEDKGAAIGLHGYRHVCASRGRSLVPLHSTSEFAGVAYVQQWEWIERGLRALRAQGLQPKVWIAPRHGFDRITCQVLRELEIEIISDGWARRPYRKLGLTWIPQQLWAPVEQPSGLWTICLHPNTVTDQELQTLTMFLDRRSAQFTSVPRVLAEWPANAMPIAERWFQWKMTARMRLRGLAR